MDFFSYYDYLDILRAKIEENAGARGYLGKLARNAGFSSSYLSQVLAGSYHLNIEHAAALCGFWQVDESSTRYFITLVQQKRVNHRALRRLFQRDAEKLRHEARFGGKLLQDATLPQRFLSPDEAIDYLGTFNFQVVYALLRIHNAPEPIAHHLGLGQDEVLAILQRLETWELVALQDDQWQIKNEPITFPPLPFISRVQHLELRHRANQYMNYAANSNSHITRIATVARKDILILKKMLEDLIESQSRIVDRSPDEELVAFCYDFFVI